MRLMLRLIAKYNQIDISSEYHKLQGFVYKLLKESGYSNIHDKKGYKFFCFSNIFPAGTMKQGDLRNFIISSPSKEIIESLSSYISTLIDKSINIGDASFILKSFEKFEIKVPRKNVIISSATPIIIRIPEYMYDIYQIPKEERKNRYLYWRKKYSFNAFLKQLTENLIKKYNDFYGTKIEYYDIFEQFAFKKEIHSNIIINGKRYGISASLWDFMWNSMDNMQKNIIEFGLDTGFGERNSMGFGFMNLNTSKNKN